MNNNKIKMKYLLGIWKSLPDYPTKEDVIYELNFHLNKKGITNGIFSENIFNYFLPPNWKETKFNEIIKELFQSNIIEKYNDPSSKTKKNLYKLNDKYLY